MHANLEVTRESGPDEGPAIGDRTKQDFEALMLPQLDYLCKIALLVLENECDAQNLVQDTFIVANASWYESPCDSDFRVWLFKIMIDILSKKYCPFARHSSYTINAVEIDGYLLYTRWANQPSIDKFDNAPMMKISSKDITKAIKSLPPDFRLLQVLYLLADFSYREISEIATIDLEKVRNMLYMGRKLLQRNIFQ